MYVLFLTLVKGGRRMEWISEQRNLVDSKKVIRSESKKYISYLLSGL